MADGVVAGIRGVCLTVDRRGRPVAYSLGHGMRLQRIAYARAEVLLATEQVPQLTRRQAGLDRPRFDAARGLVYEDGSPVGTLR